MADGLTTARLSQRRPVEGDVDAIYAIHRDPLACAHNPGDLLGSRAEAEQLYVRWDAHWQRYGHGYRVVRLLGEVDPIGSSGVIGFCGVKVMPLHGREVLNLLYRFAPAAWGNGYASEAARAVVRWAAAHAPERPLIARIRPANTASIRVATGAGLVRAARLDTVGEDGLDWIFVTDWPTLVD
ncbi:MAG: GNAT family N-acetyltransferase [Micromonosporaceae bacterium]